MKTNYIKILSVLSLAFMLLQVAPSSIAQADSDLMDRINTAINRDKTLESFPITVTSVNGFVILTGQVLNNEQKQLATQTVAFSRQPIRRIINEIVVVETINTSFVEADAALLHKIMEEISAVTSKTTVVVNDGVVHLLGALPRDEAGLVADKVSRITGVKSIKLSFEIIAN